MAAQPQSAQEKMSDSKSLPDTPAAGESQTVADDRALMSRSRRLVVRYLAAFVLTVLVLFSVNLLGNGGGVLPSPLIPCLTDRSWKARRLEEMVAAGNPPEILLFGSSYVMQFQPRYLEERTGMRAFNLGVAMGRPIDALTLLRHARSLGVRPRRVIAAFHQEAFHPGLATGTISLADYGPLLRQTPFPVNLQIVAERLGNARIWSTRQSVANLLGKSSRTRAITGVDSLLLADGYLVYTKTTIARHDGTFDLNQRLAEIRQADEQNSEPPPDLSVSPQFAYLEQFLRLASQDSAQVQLVLMPKHPDIVTERNLAERTTITERLKLICAECQCDYYDLRDVSMYAGDLAEFHDGGHQSPVNTRRIINLLLGIPLDDDKTEAPTDWEILDKLPAVTTLTTP